MGAKVGSGNDFAFQICVDSCRDIGDSALCQLIAVKVRELVNISAGLEAEMLEQGETSKAYIVPLKDGKEITGKLYIDYEKHWISVKKFEEREIMKCPICEDGVIIDD